MLNFGLGCLTFIRHHTLGRSHCVQWVSWSIQSDISSIYNGQVVGFTLVCHPLLCNHVYLHYHHHVETNDNVTSCNQPEQNYDLKAWHWRNTENSTEPKWYWTHAPVISYLERRVDFILIVLLLHLGIPLTGLWTTCSAIVDIKVHLFTNRHPTN